MESRAKGNAAEAAVLHAFASRGFHLLVPFGEGQPYDLVVDLAPAGFMRVQCKTGRQRGGCVVFNSRTTDHGRGRRSYAGHADAFGVYLPASQQVFLVPVREITGFRPHLRLEPARNNQKRRVRLASGYAIDRWTREDLIEQLLDREGVAPVGEAASPR